MIKLPFFKKQKIEKTVYEIPQMEFKDFVAPPSVVVQPEWIKIGERYAKSFYIFSYPRYLSSAWLSSLINSSLPMDIGIHIFPIPSDFVIKQLRKKITEIEAELRERGERIRDPSLEIAHHDLEMLRDRLQAAEERMFKVGLYLTIYADSLEELKMAEVKIRSILEARMVYVLPSLYQQKEGLNSASFLGLDQLQVYTALNTEPLSSFFPFVSFDLSSGEGILYGINRHNNSLILFDRFSLENANEVVFGKSGSGKSYFVKSEILRHLMCGVEVIIIDPENEYKALAEAVKGTFLNISLNSPHHLNPFDLPPYSVDEKPEEILRSNIINLVGLMRILLGGLTPEEDAIMDRALTETYALKDITPKTDPKTWQKNVPLMEDLERVLEGMEGTESLLRRLRRYTRGTFAQFFNQPTNVELKNPLVVFGIRDMEDELKPAAMFIILRYIWNIVRSELKKRILVVDEAWWLMKNEDSASFLYGLCKRARKYWLGVTTITQDVGDFMKSTYGQPIITNSSIQVLMKQSPATIDIVQKTFNLTDEEKYLLLECEVGEGIFFAGKKHVLMKVVASYAEDQLITTSPEQILKIKMAKKEMQKDHGNLS